MDTKEDTDVKTAPEAPAMPAPVVPGPREPGAVPSVPLHGPVDVADDSLEGLQSAFRALSVKCIVRLLDHIVLVLRVHNKPFYPCLALQNQIVLNEYLHSN